MDNNSSHNERRKHPRYQVPKLVIAVSKKSNSQVGRIVNVSKGGIAVRYMEQMDWLGEAEEIDILVNSDFFITDIPVENIRDFKVSNHISSSVIIERQCCLKFRSFLPGQESLLDEFITKYSAGSS